MRAITFKYTMRVLGTLFFVLLVVSSCKKKENNGNTTVITGSARVDLSVKHHAWSVPNAKVYIKNNCTSFPGRSPSLYNSYLTANNNGYVSFDNLANGNYFFYAIGFDVAVQDTVWGYNTVLINNAPGETKQYDLIVPVSE